MYKGQMSSSFNQELGLRSLNTSQKLIIINLPITWTLQIAQVSHSTSQDHIATAFHFFKVNNRCVDCSFWGASTSILTSISSPLLAIFDIPRGPSNKVPITNGLIKVLNSRTLTVTNYYFDSCFEKWRSHNRVTAFLRRSERSNKVTHQLSSHQGILHRCSNNQAIWCRCSNNLAIWCRCSKWAMLHNNNLATQVPLPLNRGIHLQVYFLSFEHAFFLIFALLVNYGIFLGAPHQHGGGWMPVPQVQFDCPPGLEYLTQIDQLLIHQQVELLEGVKNSILFFNHMIRSWNIFYFALEFYCSL